MWRVGFEPTPFRTRTLIWRLRPTRPSPLAVSSLEVYSKGYCLTRSIRPCRHVALAYALVWRLENNWLF